MTSTVTLSAGAYSVVVDPDGGGAILSADWLSPGNTKIAILEPMSAAPAPFKAGCFAMVPFANRIADGRFRFENSEYSLPINHPVDHTAIHGFGRENPWRVVEETAATLTLEQDFAQADIPYRYVARQEIALSGAGISISLTVRNNNTQAMPFGIGLHPWFPKTASTSLSFASSGVMGRDQRGLPVPPAIPDASFAPEAPTALAELPWFDGFFEGWEPQRARIERPEEGLAIELTATGALRHLHVFVPDDRPVFCAEPVSHAPDAINRPELGSANAMHVLAPGARLTGTMTLRAMPLSSRSEQRS